MLFLGQIRVADNYFKVHCNYSDAHCEKQALYVLKIEFFIFIVFLQISSFLARKKYVRDLLQT